MRRIRLRRRNLCSVKQSGLQLRKNRKHRLRRQYRKKRLPCRYNRNERIPPRLKPNQFRKTRRLRFRRCRCGKNRRSRNAGFLGAGWTQPLLLSHFSYFALPPPKRTAEANRQMVIAQQAAEREKREQEERRAGAGPSGGRSCRAASARGKTGQDRSTSNRRSALSGNAV